MANSPAVGLCERVSLPSPSVSDLTTQRCSTKFFASPDTSIFLTSILRRSFRNVFTFKPSASRSESSESYFICKGFIGGMFHDSPSGSASAVSARRGDREPKRRKGKKKPHFLKHPGSATPKGKADTDGGEQRKKKSLLESRAKTKTVQ